MSNENDSQPRSQRLLEHLVEEARETTPADLAEAGIDWDRVDEALFARIEREAAGVRARASHRGRSGAWLLLGGVAAAAAAAAVSLQPVSHSSPPLSTVSGMGSAGDLTLQKGAGEILVDGAKARPGAFTRSGDTIRTHGAKAVFEAPGRVSWLVEDESSVTVERAGVPGTSIVLALQQGAIEAQVSPVASGEAFAVDVDGVRVAVHGTHLRVARDGDRVVVDLSEGVVSIGAPPKSGSTYGTLVTAPAHVEFHSDELASSLTVDHVATAVRKALDLDSVMDDDASASITPPPPAPRSDDTVTPQPKRGAVASSQPRPAVATRNRNAERDLATAVRACAAAEPFSGQVKATYEGKIILQVKEDGSVAEPSIISPPIKIESIHRCVTRAIYDARFTKPGEHQVSIDFQLP